MPEGQIVWCFTCKHEIKPEVSKVLWELEVPEQEIVRFVDDIVWNRILGIKCWLPSSLRRTFRSKALEKFPYSADERKNCVKEQEEAFWSQDAPTGSWWDSLFVHQKSCKGVSAIVRHPLRHEWVVQE